MQKQKYRNATLERVIFRAESKCLAVRPELANALKYGESGTYRPKKWSSYFGGLTTMRPGRMSSDSTSSYGNIA